MSVWQRTGRLAASAALVCGGVILGFILAGSSSATGAETQETSTVVHDNVAMDAMVPQGTFVDVAKKVRATVVFIEAARAEERPAGDGRFNRFFDDFFGGERRREDDDAPEDRPQFDGMRRSQGSGVLISPDGYILTNAHVVAAFNANTQSMDLAREVQVTLSDDTRYDAEIVGADLGTDIALLKVEGTGLEYARLGDSDSLQVGEWVMAVGAPFGLQNTVSAGIVSALGRAVSGMQTTSYQDFVQTDAAINPGNSGGPLVNLRGDVIGINTAIATGGAFNPTFSGVGFAVPVNMARRVMTQLREHGRVIRGYLGVTVQELSRDFREAYSLDTRLRGAIIRSVTDDGPAAAAGLQPEDIVIAMNGERLHSQQDFLQRIATQSPDDTVQLSVLRGKGDGTDVEIDIEITLIERPDEAKVLADRFNLNSNARDRAENNESDEEPFASDLLDKLGLRVTAKTARLARQLRLPEDVDGAVVGAVAENSPAALARLAQGDVIMGVNRVPVAGVEEFIALLAELSSPGRPLALRIYDARQRAVGFRTLRVPRD